MHQRTLKTQNSTETSQKTTQPSTNQKPNPEISEKKVDGRKRGFRSAYKNKVEKQYEEQQPVSTPLPSEENCLNLLQEPQMVINKQPRPEAKEVPISSNTSISQRSNSNDSSSLKQNHNHQHRHSSISRQESKPALQEPKPELPTSIDIGNKIWKLCRFDAGMNGCRNSSQDCKFIHLDLIEQVALSDKKKLANVAIWNWDQAKLDSKYQPSDKDLLNSWVNSNSNEGNPLFIKYKTMIEEKDPEFVQLTKDLTAEQMELEELQNAFQVKKQRYMSELSSRLRQKILFKSRQKAFDKLLSESAQKRTAASEAALSQESSSIEYLPPSQQKYSNRYQMIPHHKEQYLPFENSQYSSLQQQPKSPIRTSQQQHYYQQNNTQSYQPQHQAHNWNPTYQHQQSNNQRFEPSYKPSYY
uniref:ORF1 n=1 Tax=Tetrahymena thermophila TaxID=5911 RepID=Q6UE75_TETTH|nr:ORF1 [Tetrahymena thermophila]